MDGSHQGAYGLKYPTFRQMRMASQLACLASIFWLFLQTDYKGHDTLRYPVSLLFRLDPLAALVDVLAPGTFHWQLLWPALVLLVLTLLFGRFFCGWICPMGTSLDLLGMPTGQVRPPVRKGWYRGKYYLLAALTASALFGVQLFGLFDPLSIFLRSLTIAIYPAVNLVLNGIFDQLYNHPTPLLSPLADASYPFFRNHLLAFNQPVFALSIFTFGVFLGLVLLERLEKRFWCKYLCPLGALLGICSRHSLLTYSEGRPCTDCSACTFECRMDAVSAQGHRKSECLLCFDCTSFCPDGRAGVRVGRKRPGGLGIDLTRRGMLTALVSGAILAPVAHIAPQPGQSEPYLLRPPGAVEETEFQRRCIRCGECMKVCIGQALHPAFLQSGATGLWTPLLIPRIGYCEYNCTLCGQVCPTGAIRHLPAEVKRKQIIGLAVFDKNRCLPFARGEECLVCEEHCPTGEKAIGLEEKDVLVNGKVRRVKLPYVVRERCIGCGICETRCPVEGRSAVRVVNEGESRKSSFLKPNNRDASGLGVMSDYSWSTRNAPGHQTGGVPCSKIGGK